MLCSLLSRTRSGPVEVSCSSPIGAARPQTRSKSSLPLVLERAASAPLPAVVNGAVAFTAPHFKAPLEKAVDYSKAVLQAELAWVREQLDRERSRSNGADAHMEQRRTMMELAQQTRRASKLQSQMKQMEAVICQAQATISQQKKDLASMGRAQAMADWTSYANTRKRLITSIKEVDNVTSRASQAERALQQEHSNKAQLLQEIEALKEQNNMLQAQCNLYRTAENHGPTEDAQPEEPAPFLTWLAAQTAQPELVPAQA